MEIRELLAEAHHLVEASERRRITHAEMAQRLNVSSRTYTEYLRGTNAPLAMQALLNLLSMMKDDAIIHVVREWQK